MMQGYLNGLNRVQQARVREAMARTDPEGLASRWCNTVLRELILFRHQILSGMWTAIIDLLGN